MVQISCTSGDMTDWLKGKKVDSISFFFEDRVTIEIFTRGLVGSVRYV